MMVRPRLGMCLVALLACLPVASAGAQPLSAADAGVLAGSCMACHGPGGVSHGAIPSIAGRAEGDMSALLIAFRSGAVPGATVMTRIMKGFDDTEIAALARYYAAQPAGKQP